VEGRRGRGVGQGGRTSKPEGLFPRSQYPPIFVRFRGRRILLFGCGLILSPVVGTQRHALTMFLLPFRLTTTIDGYFFLVVNSNFFRGSFCNSVHLSFFDLLCLFCIVLTDCFLWPFLVYSSSVFVSMLPCRLLFILFIRQLSLILPVFVELAPKNLGAPFSGE